MAIFRQPFIENQKFFGCPILSCVCFSCKNIIKIGRPPCPNFCRFLATFALKLNMYTTPSYIKWHKTNPLCPLCTQPVYEFHLIFNCPFVTSLWKQIEPVTHGELTCHYLKKLAYTCFVVLYLQKRKFGISQ